MKGRSRTKHLDSPAVAAGDGDESAHNIGDQSRIVSEEVEILGGPVNQLEGEKRGTANEHEAFGFAQREKRGGNIELSTAEFSHRAPGR